MIESVENPAIKARSSGQFTIKKLQIEIKVMSPNTGLTWSRGTTQNIGWVYSGKPGTTVKITLEKSEVPVQVVVESYAIYQQIENFGNYVWNIPTNSSSINPFLRPETSMPKTNS